MFPKLVKQLTRIIIPFAYDDYKHAIQQINPAYWNTKNMDMRRLFTHIEKLISSENLHGVIGRRYILQQKGRRTYSLPHNHNHILQFHVDRSHCYDLLISNVELYLFETDVGFLVYEIDYGENMNMEQIINANYHLKKIYDENLLITYEFKEAKDQTVIKTIKLAELTADLLKDFKIKTYFEASKKNLPFHAIVFNAILIDDPMIHTPECERILTEYLFHMRRSFKESYKPSEFTFDKVDNPACNYLKIAIGESH